MKKGFEHLDLSGVVYFIMLFIVLAVSRDHLIFA